MARELEHEVQYYYDTHPTEEDLMGETSFHAGAITSLMQVLQWLFRAQLCAIYENLNFYQTRDPREYPLAPDLAIIKGVPFEELRSWKVGRTGPAPHVVFEMLSEETWRKDVEEKPARYGLMGVQEYVVYDPNEPMIVRPASRRLLGWRRDPIQGEMLPLLPDAAGRLWSPHLSSWLVPDGVRLRLSDEQGHRRLTEAEAATRQADAEAAARQREARRADAEARRADTEARRADAEAKRAEALAEKLRSLGANPDEL